MRKDHRIGILFGSLILLSTFLLFLASDFAGLAFPNRFLSILILAGLIDLAVVFLSVALGYLALSTLKALRPSLIPNIPEYILSFGLGILMLYFFFVLYSVSIPLMLFFFTLLLLAGAFASSSKPKHHRRQKPRS